MLLGDPRQSDQRTQSFHFPIVVHQSLDRTAQSSAQAPSTSKFERSTGSESERVDALGLRAVEVIICMITRDFSVISMTSQASLSLSLPLTKVTDAQYRKRFRASYNYRKRFRASYNYFRKRGSASYIVREVLSVREREREIQTDRERRKWRHLCRAKIGDEFTLSLAKNIIYTKNYWK